MMEDGLSELVLITFSDVNGSSDNSEGEIFWVGSAISVLGCVWVVFVKGKTMALYGNVLESMRWKSTIASMVIEITSAINQLLF